MSMFTESRSREKYGTMGRKNSLLTGRKDNQACVWDLPADGLKEEGKGAQGGEKERYRPCTSCKDSIINSTFVLHFKEAADQIQIISFFVCFRTHLADTGAALTLPG